MTDITTRKRNDFLDIASDDDASDRGYDSEAAEETKGRNAKRRRMQSKTDDLSGSEDEAEGSDIEDDETSAKATDAADGGQYLEVAETEQSSSSNKKQKQKKPLDKPKKKKKPGVVYLSSVPPYMKPFALKNMLEQRSFGPITRIFLAPVVKSASAPRHRSNKRKLYGEGWVEFASKATAKLAAESLNATTMGGNKGNYYYDDLLNIKYLRGMSWDQLMDQIQNERKEREARQRQADIRARKEEKLFLEGVEQGKKLEGIIKKNEEKRKRKMAEADAAAAAAPPQASLKVRRTFKQNEVKHGRDKIKSEGVGEDTKRVLGKIF